MATVASAFDHPPSYPGYHWSRAGQTIDEFELVTIAGPDHCGWDSATFLFIGWPPGTRAETGSAARQFVRDPRGVFGARFRDGLRRNVALPADAQDTGFRYWSLAIYVAPSDPDGIYVVSPRDAERWPRSDPPTLCA